MYNIILDRLPDNFNGYLIRTDFRIGIQITLAMNDVNLHSDEKIKVASELLFGNGKPNDKQLIEGIKWFLSGGEIKETSDTSGVRCFDFNQDNMLILSAFRTRYNIDLARVNMHWFEFVALLGDIGDCALSKIIDIRSVDISKMSGEQRNEYAKLKQTYELKPQISDDEKNALDDFESKLH